MAITTLDSEWRHWVDSNVARGCDPAELYQILLNHGFCPTVSARTLNYWPINPQDIRVLKKPAENSAAAHKEAEAARAAPQNAIPVDTGGRLQLYRLDNFLSAQECLRLIALIGPSLRPSTTTNEADQYTGYRTSSTCDLGLIQDASMDEFVRGIDRRICHILGINPDYSESIQAQWYQPGQQFKPHTDYFEPGSEEYRRFAGARGQRTWTFMIYLNGECEGGATRFTKLDKAFAPQTGSALIWNSLKKDGSPNPDSIHWGMPVTKGEKVIITKWFRARGEGEQLVREKIASEP